MKKYQKLTNKDYEVALFPMEYMNITQGRYSGFSHKTYNAYDLGGKDYNIDDVMAPFTLKVEWTDTGAHKTGVVVSNAKKVLMANGNIQQPRTLLMMLWHSNSIKHLSRGQVIIQGTPLYKEGTAGMAYGNHVHMELAYGVYKGGYPLYLLGNGYWTLKGQELNIEDAFYINDTVIRDRFGYTFKTYVAAQKPTGKYNVGDNVEFKTIANRAVGGTVINAYYQDGKIAKIYKNADFPYMIEHKGTAIGFVNDNMIGKNTMPPAVTGNIKANDTVELKHNAKTYATGQTIPAVYKGKHYTVQQIRPNEALLKEIASWVYQKDLKQIKKAPVTGTDKWLRIPTTISSYAYYRPEQKYKNKANKWGTLYPIQYKAQGAYLEYKVIAEKGNFKTIQLHGNPVNPKIDIFTGKGTENAWSIVRR